MTEGTMAPDAARLGVLLVLALAAVVIALFDAAVPRWYLPWLRQLSRTRPKGTSLSSRRSCAT